MPDSKRCFSHNNIHAQWVEIKSAKLLLFLNKCIFTRYLLAIFYYGGFIKFSWKWRCTCPSELILTHCVSLALRQNTKSLPFSCFSLGKLLLRSKLSRLRSSQWKKEIRSGQRDFVWSVCGLYLVFARSLHGLCAIFAWTFCGLWKLLYNFWFASGCIIDICSLII